MKNVTDKQALIVSALGNMLVWYNFALFMPFLPILSKYFFPIKDPVLCDVVTFAAMSAGLFIRPVGSLIFGPIGDKIGREKAISLAVLLMAFSTFLIGFIPSYEQIGILSPILLVLLRTLQGISMGGEFTAAMVHLVEIAPSSRRGLFGSFSDAGSQIGVLLAGQALLFLYTFFSEAEIYQYAWKLPFFAAVILIPFAFMHPKQEKDSSKCQEKKENQANAAPKKSLLETLIEYKVEVLSTIAITAFSAIAFYTLLNFLPYYLVSEGIITLKEAAICSVIANTCMISSILVSGFLSDLFSRRIFLQTGMITVTIVTYVMFLCDILDTFAWYIIHAAYGIFIGMYYGSRAAFFSESFPKHIRCTGVSISFSIAQAIFGGGISIVLKYCMLASKYLVVLPITVMVIVALIATVKIKKQAVQ